MARQILPTIDLRTSEQKRGLSASERNISAITGLLQTLGKSEQQRQEKDTLNRMIQTVTAGQTDIGSITQAAGQPAERGSGLSGILQSIGNIYKPQGGGIEQGLQKTILGEILKQSMAPKPLLSREERVKAARIKGGLELGAQKPTQTASPLQVAKQNGSSGLPEGTVFQTDPKGNVNIIAEAQLLTLDEQRKTLQDAGVEEREIAKLDKQYKQVQIKALEKKIKSQEKKEQFTLSPGQQRFGAEGERIAGVPERQEKPEKRTKATELLEQIDSKIADGTLEEGSKEHMRLLGAGGDKIKTPEDKLQYWQTVLIKTRDSIGSILEGQEDTAKLAVDKIKEAKDGIRKEIDSGGTATKKLTPEIARQYLNMAGNNTEEAKRLAAKDGYVE